MAMLGGECSPCCGGWQCVGDCKLRITNALKLFDGVLVKFGPTVGDDFRFHFEAKISASACFGTDRIIYEFNRSSDTQSIPGVEVLVSQGQGTAAWRLQRLVVRYECVRSLSTTNVTPEGVSRGDLGGLFFQIIYGPDDFPLSGEGVFHGASLGSVGIRGEEAYWIGDTNLLCQGNMMGLDQNLLGVQTWVSPSGRLAPEPQLLLYQGALGSPFSPNPNIGYCELYKD